MDPTWQEVVVLLGMFAFMAFIAWAGDKYNR
jgi:hypothetical protein